MTRRRALWSLPLLALAPSCTAAPEAAAVALRDPYGLIDDVVGSGNSLRLYVVPSEAYGCSGDGSVTPEIPDVPAGAFGDAIVDITLDADPATDSAGGEARVPVGNWTIFVRGKGTDPVSMVPNSVIAVGCATVEMLGAGETREVPIVLQPRSGMGVCGDGILSPDEQCDTPGMRTCAADCTTSPAPFNVMTTTGLQTAPRLAARAGFRTVGVFDSRPITGFRLLDPNGFTIVTPAALANDVSVDEILGGMSLPGEQLGGQPALAADGRIAVPLTDFAMPADTDVRVVFIGQDRNLVGGPAHVRTARTMPQRRPVAAFSGNALLVAFEDVASATGISTAFFAAGATSTTEEARPAGQAGASEPALAAHDAGFVLAFTQGGDVYFQRFDADGAALDAMGRPVLESAGGTQDQPAVASLGGGTFVVAWREGDVAAGDGAGTAIRARVFGSDGAARGAAFVVNSTTAGEQASPSVAAADGRFCFAWQSGGEVRGAFFGENGMRLLSRERPPAAADFLVAAGGASLPSVVAVGTGADAGWLVGYAAPTDGTGDVLTRRYPR